MSRLQPQFTEEAKEEIRQAMTRENNKKAYIKLQILKMKIVCGMSSIEIAKITGYHKNSINKLITRYRKNGIEQTTHPTYGRNHAYMTVEEEKEFLEPYLERAKQGQILEVSEIKSACIEKLGKAVSNRMIYELLKRHKWRKVMPRSKHPKKADDKAIEAYKKNN